QFPPPESASPGTGADQPSHDVGNVSGDRAPLASPQRRDARGRRTMARTLGAGQSGAGCVATPVVVALHWPVRIVDLDSRHAWLACRRCGTRWGGRGLARDGERNQALSGVVPGALRRAPPVAVAIGGGWRSGLEPGWEYCRRRLVRRGALLYADPTRRVGALY